MGGEGRSGRGRSPPPRSFEQRRVTRTRRRRSSRRATRSTPLSRTQPRASASRGARGTFPRRRRRTRIPGTQTRDRRSRVASRGVRRRRETVSRGARVSRVSLVAGEACGRFGSPGSWRRFASSWRTRSPPRGLCDSERARRRSPGTWQPKAAAERRKRYERSRLGSRESAAAATLATAHYHLGVIPADAALAADERGGAGSRSAAGTKAGGLCEPGVSPPRRSATSNARSPGSRGGRTAGPRSSSGAIARVSRPPPRAPPRLRGGRAGGPPPGKFPSRTCSPPRRRFSDDRHPRRREKSRRGGPRHEETSSPRCWTLEALVRSSKGGNDNAAKTTLNSSRAGIALPGAKRRRAKTAGTPTTDGAGATGGETRWVAAATESDADASWGWRSRGNCESTPRRARVARQREGERRRAGKRGGEIAVSAAGPLSGLGLKPTDPGQNYVDDRGGDEKSGWMKRLVAPCVRLVRLSKALLLVSCSSLRGGVDDARGASEGERGRNSPAGSGARRRSASASPSSSPARGRRFAGPVPVLVPGAPAPPPCRHPPSQPGRAPAAEQPRHLLTPRRRASFEVAVFAQSPSLDRALIASLASASGRAHPEQVSVGKPKSPPAIHLAAVGNPTRLRTTVIDAQVSRLRHADASSTEHARPPVSDAQAAASRRRRAPLDQASPTAAVCSGKTPKPASHLPHPFASRSLPASSVGDASPAPTSAEPVAARAGRAARLARSLVVVLRAHSASPGAVPARLVRAHANAAVGRGTGRHRPPCGGIRE